jgi:uroporphyrin-III C-methyltransferase
MMQTLGEMDIAPGSVVLVGAGPGDPDLLTVAALKALRAADVVVHDALVSPEILQQIPPDCLRVYAGKRGGSPSIQQGDISGILVTLAREGKRVVRLKGGDPFVFGRGGEEALYLAAHGIPFRIVPGLTSGIAGPAYAGIPVTHREVNASVAFITGHENDAGTSRVDWEHIGQLFPVLVLYMAMENLSAITRRLMAGGRAGSTPVAIISWATTPQQKTWVTTLERAYQDAQQEGLKPPAIVVIGDVVDLRATLAWFPPDLPAA